MHEMHHQQAILSGLWTGPGLDFLCQENICLEIRSNTKPSTTGYNVGTLLPRLLPEQDLERAPRRFQLRVLGPSRPPIELF
jgi:hypothetical protein